MNSSSFNLNRTLVPHGYSKWRITTKFLTHLPKGCQSARETYAITAATCDVIDGHVVFRDASGMVKHVRAMGTFETVTLVESDDA